MCIYSSLRLFFSCIGSFFFLIGFTQKNKIVDLKTIGLNQGLSSLNVRNIIEDKNGFIWFSTQDGLNRYDGCEIIQFTKNNMRPSRQLMGSDCFAMSYTKGENLLYVNSLYEGLNVIDIDKCAIVQKKSIKELGGRETMGWLKAMTRLNGVLLLSTNNKLIFYDVKQSKPDTNRNITLHEESNINNIFVYKRYIGLIGFDSKIMLYDTSTLSIVRSIQLPAYFKDVVANSVSLLSNKLWFSSRLGIHVVDLQNGEFLNTMKEMQNCPPECLYQFSTSVYVYNDDFFFSNSVGTYKYNFGAKNLTRLLSLGNSSGDDEYLKSANCFRLIDKSLWVAGPYGVGQVCNLSSPFTSIYNDKYNNKVEHVFSLMPSNNGNMLIGTDDGFYKVELVTHLVKKVLNNETVYSFGRIHKDEYLVSGSKSLYVFQNNSIQKASLKYSELSKLDNEVLIDVKNLNDSITLLASDLKTGLYSWNRSRHTVESFSTKSKISLTDDAINTILIEKNDIAYIVSESVIHKFDYKKRTIEAVVDRKKLGADETGIFMDLCKQGTNYWIAVYGQGIIEVNSAFIPIRKLTTKNSINNIGLYKIFNVGDSLIVATSNNGLIIYNIKQDKVRTYYGEDGLHSNAFEETSGYQQSDTLYIGGLRGFTIFNTKNYRENNTPPKLYLNTLSYETPAGTTDTTNLFIKDFEIPNNATQTKITFTGLNYINPKRVTYQYRIKELQNEWTDNKFQNFISPIGTPPGTYTLEVKAANEDGVECAPISMTLHFLPKWYQTWQFKLAVVLAIAGLLYTLYSFRIRQLKRIISVRQKISSDLHDDIGSTLSTINMYSQVAQLHGPGHVPIMHNIQENAQEVLEKLDDIVWATNPKNDQVKNLAERIDAFARPLFQAKEVAFIFNAETHISSHKIGEATRQNLFLICKEAITNAAKYAECKTCTVSLYKKRKYIHCSITDDGKGFDASLPTERNGLLNMKLRAAAVKGKLEIISSIGNGTSIIVVMPL